MNESEVIRLKIRAVMSATLMTPKILAARAGISVGHLYNILSGGQNSQKGRARIEALLGKKFWPSPGSSIRGKTSAFNPTARKRAHSKEKSST